MINNNELITVIVPVYNREKYLKRCIESILSQEQVKIEIILVDDGSKDDSPRICDDYKARFDNIIVIHQSNKGLSAARNAGLDVAKGDYIFFVDSDDYIEKGALRKLLSKILENDADFAMGKYERFFEDGRSEYVNNIPDNLRNRVLDKNELLSLMYIENSYLWCVAWGKLYKREVFDKVRFPVGKNSEDEYIMPQILEKIKKVYLLDERLYDQVLSENSIVRKALSVKSLDATEAILVMSRYLLDKGLYEYALFRFGVGTRHLIKWKSETSDKLVLARIKEQYIKYRVFARGLMPYVDIKARIRLVLFNFDFRLYAMVRKFKQHLKRN